MTIHYLICRDVEVSNLLRGEREEIFIILFLLITRRAPSVPAILEIITISHCITAIGWGGGGVGGCGSGHVNTVTNVQ